MVAEVGHPAAVDDSDPVHAPDRGVTVGDDDRRTPGEQPAQGRRGARRRGARRARSRRRASSPSRRMGRRTARRTRLGDRTRRARACPGGPGTRTGHPRTRRRRVSRGARVPGARRAPPGAPRATRPRARSPPARRGRRGGCSRCWKPRSSPEEASKSSSTREICAVARVGMLGTADQGACWDVEARLGRFRLRSSTASRPRRAQLDFDVQRDSLRDVSRSCPGPGQPPTAGPP